MVIPWCKPQYWGNEKKYVNEAIDSMWISDGPFVHRLDKMFAEMNQIEFALSTSNGTTALQLSLLALDIKAGDEILVPGFGFAAAANMVVAVGAKPIFVDVDPATMLMDPEKIEAVITKSTKGIMPIHSYGNVCDMDRIVQIAKSKKLFVFEDVAEAMFSKWNGRFAGTYSDVSAFSLHATKTVTTGEGGMVLTHNEDLKKKMALIKSHGMAGKKYWHVCHAYNFRMTNFQAALGVAQLEKAPVIIQERRRVYDLYKKHLRTVDGIRIQEIAKNVDPVIWAMPIVIQPEAFKFSRDELIDQLLSAGIETRPGFYTFNQMGMYDSPLLKNSDVLAKNIICLPFYTAMNESDVQFISQEILKLKR